MYLNLMCHEMGNCHHLKNSFWHYKINSKQTVANIKEVETILE